jgi:hypothetical protein
VHHGSAGRQNAIVQGGNRRRRSVCDGVSCRELVDEDGATGEQIDQPTTLVG